MLVSDSRKFWSSHRRVLKHLDFKKDQLFCWFMAGSPCIQCIPMCVPPWTWILLPRGIHEFPSQYHCFFWVAACPPQCISASLRDFFCPLFRRGLGSLQIPRVPSALFSEKQRNNVELFLSMSISNRIRRDFSWVGIKSKVFYFVCMFYKSDDLAKHGLEPQLTFEVFFVVVSY